MNANTVRWELHNYHTNAKVIEQIKDDLREYRLMDGIKAQVITDMPLTHSNASKTEKIGITRAEYISKLEDKLDSMMRVKMAIDSVYLYLKEPHRSIIEMRYFILSSPNDVRQRKYNWQEIAIEVKYCEAYCKEIDANVILQIQNKIRELSYDLPTT